MASQKTAMTGRGLGYDASTRLISIRASPGRTATTIHSTASSATCLSMEWFRNRIDAKIVIEQFRRHYNQTRPHSSLVNLTPEQFKQKVLSTNQTQQAIS
jgi:transposase InsO family protein